MCHGWLLSPDFSQVCWFWLPWWPSSYCSCCGGRARCCSGRDQPTAACSVCRTSSTTSAGWQSELCSAVPSRCVSSPESCVLCHLSCIVCVFARNARWAKLINHLKHKEHWHEQQMVIKLKDCRHVRYYCVQNIFRAPPTELDRTISTCTQTWHSTADSPGSTVTSLWLCWTTWRRASSPTSTKLLYVGEKNLSSPKC